MEWRITMLSTYCCQCGLTETVISEKGLCWNCHSTKEKSHYRYMVHSSSLLLFFTILLSTLFLLNALPTLLLFHHFSESYSTNQYIRVGAELLFFSIYLICKFSIVVNLWKSRYVGIGYRYLNIASEILLLLIKFSLMIHYFQHTVQWELQLAPFTESISKYTDDFLSSEYLSFVLVFLFLFALLRAIFCILAYWFNYYYERHFHLFYEKHPNRKRINNIARWELFYKKHPERLKKHETLFVAAKVESPMSNCQHQFKQEIAAYVSDPEQQLRFETIFLSKEDSISLFSHELSIYYMYVKNQLAQWKEDNLSTDAYINSLLDELLGKFNSIKERFNYCEIENKRYFELSNRMKLNLENPKELLTIKRNLITNTIQELFRESSLWTQKQASKKELNDTIALLSTQAINFSDYELTIDDELIHFDNVIITNRGVFVLLLETFDSTAPLELLIERDGTWYQRKHDPNTNSEYEFFNHTFTGTHNKHLLYLEKMINERMDSPLESYLELHLLLVITNNNLKLKNHSTQTMIHTSEFLPQLRSHPICLSEDKMLYLKEILESYQQTNEHITIPNYRKLIIDQLDYLLKEKIQLVQQNSDLIHQTSILASDYAKKRKTPFLPLISR